MSLPGRSKTIRVEPVRPKHTPAPAPKEQPTEAPKRQPKKTPA